MRFLALTLLAITLLVGFVFYKNRQLRIPIQVPPETARKDVSSSAFVVAKDLDTPWALAFLPDGNLLVTERPGRVDEINPKTGNKETIATLGQAKEIGEGGLLGMALHPDFISNKFIYFYYTYEGDGNDTLNRVVRMIYKDKKLTNEEIIVDKIPAAGNHNGGRIKFGPDGALYITTGDAGNSSAAQDTKSLAGKILRVTDEGKTVAGNPFNSLVYSYGHRNPQGLAWDRNGQLWATEHGRSGIQSGLDELNKIQLGKNFGWPAIQGDEKKEGMETPVINSGPTTTWAPAGLAYLPAQAGLDGSLFWGGLRGQTLYEGAVVGDKVTLKEHFKGEFGRIRDVVLGPDNMLYITTSNLDGRGNPKEGDDKIIRVDSKALHRARN